MDWIINKIVISLYGLKRRQIIYILPAGNKERYYISFKYAAFEILRHKNTYLIESIKEFIKAPHGYERNKKEPVFIITHEDILGIDLRVREIAKQRGLILPVLLDK